MYMGASSWGKKKKQSSFHFSPPVLRAIICYTLNREVYFMAENKQETDNLEQTLKRIREAQRIYSGYTQSQVDKIFFAAA
jgi:hypothetical protein